MIKIERIDTNSGPSFKTFTDEGGLGFFLVIIWTYIGIVIVKIIS